MSHLRQDPRFVADVDLSYNPPQLRSALLQQRCFRLEQLSELAASASATPPPHLTSRRIRGLCSCEQPRWQPWPTDIDAALNRMRLGCYGRCPSCDKPIELERLKFCPSLP